MHEEGLVWGDWKVLVEFGAADGRVGNQWIEAQK